MSIDRNTRLILERIRNGSKFVEIIPLMIGREEEESVRSIIKNYRPYLNSIYSRKETAAFALTLDHPVIIGDFLSLMDVINDFREEAITASIIVGKTDHYDYYQMPSRVENALKLLTEIPDSIILDSWTELHTFELYFANRITKNVMINRLRKGQKR